MMLPSSLPLIRLFNRTAAPQPQANVVRAAFLGGYVLIWTAFGALAFGGDIVVHAAVDRWAWLEEHAWLIGGSTLAAGGRVPVLRPEEALPDGVPQSRARSC